MTTENTVVKSAKQKKSPETSLYGRTVVCPLSQKRYQPKFPPEQDFLKETTPSAYPLLYEEVSDHSSN